MNSDIVAASLVNARPDPTIATRGRYAGPRQDRAALRRQARAERPIRITQGHPQGPRAERRMLASPTLRPPRLAPVGRASAARYRARVALAACTTREAGR